MVYKEIYSYWKSTRNTISTISVCIQEFCSEATGQWFYYAAVPYIYPLEYMLTMTCKLLAFADSFCNSKEEMQSQHYGLFFLKEWFHLKMELILFFWSIYFYIYTYILICIYILFLYLYTQ